MLGNRGMQRIVLGVVVWATGVSGFAADQLGPEADKLQAARKQAVTFLKAAQREDGSWTSSEAPGVTGLITFGLLSAGVPADDPSIVKALKHLESFRQADGGVYFPKTHHGNYETAISLMVFKAANKGAQYDQLLADGAKYVRSVQWDETEKTDKSDVKFGGAGYGRSSHPICNESRAVPLAASRLMVF